MSSVRQAGSTNSGAYSDLKIDWDRPKDAVKGDLNSCIESYAVQIVRVSGDCCRVTPAAGHSLAFCAV